MTRGFETANAEATVALRRLVGTLSDDDLRVDLGEGWNVAMALAHLAYWDAYHLARWEHAAASGWLCPPDASDDITGRSNEALVATWRALPGGAAAALALEAADAIDALVATLSAEQVERVRAGGHANLVERAPHRLEHVEQIGRALGRG